METDDGKNRTEKEGQPKDGEKEKDFKNGCHQRDTEEQKGPIKNDKSTEPQPKQTDNVMNDEPKETVKDKEANGPNKGGQPKQSNNEGKGKEGKKSTENNEEEPMETDDDQTQIYTHEDFNTDSDGRDADDMEVYSFKNILVLYRIIL